MNSIGEVEQRIAELRASMLPLQKFYGLKSRTIEERYEDYQRKQALLNNVTKPRFKLPKL